MAYPTTTTAPNVTSTLHEACLNICAQFLALYGGTVPAGGQHCFFFVPDSRYPSRWVMVDPAVTTIPAYIPKAAQFSFKFDAAFQTNYQEAAKRLEQTFAQYGAGTGVTLIDATYDGISDNCYAIAGP